MDPTKAITQSKGIQKRKKTSPTESVKSAKIPIKAVKEMKKNED